MHNYGVKSEETKMVLFKLFDCNSSKCSTQHKHCLFYVSYLFVQVNGIKTFKKNTFTYNNKDSIPYSNIS